MRPPESFLGQPIRDLQTMLRALAKTDNAQGGLVPDGIYGVKTVGAVSEFQRDNGLPVTGVTDEATWNAIFSAYGPVKISAAPAFPLYILLNANQIITKGERNENLYIVQAVLMVLSRRYSSIYPPAITGILDEQTRESLASFQNLSNLPITGELDKITWKHLALQFPLAANLNDLTDYEDSSQIL